MRAPLTFALALTLTASVAFAQEGPGAGRMELAAFPGGGIIFDASSSEETSTFGNYAVGAGFTLNFNRWIGIEGEVGSAVGVRQTMEVNGVTLPRQHSPCFFGYSGNAVFSPLGSDRSVVPYATGGVGGLRMLDTDDVTALGITGPANFLTVNGGGGVKWFTTRHWGLRTDYRLMVVANEESTPAFFARDASRYGHRFYAGLLFTY
jgi:hypothetical protein